MGPLRIGGRSIPAAEYARRTVLPLMEVTSDRDRLCAAIAHLGWWRDARLPGGRVLFSAYHTPTVPGSLTRDARFRYPLYRRPPGSEATRIDTAQILGGALEGRGLELVWLEDLYDALALQVEGAGQVRLPDGRIFSIGTDGHNGRPYQNVSKLLAADGHLNGVSAPPTSKPGNPKARAYFAAHPDELTRYWGRNPHFVYFKQVAQAGGGKLGVLTNGRSLAVDPSVYPLGTVLFVRPQRGFADGDGTRARVAVAMDTGAAIVGPGRIDVYFGDEEDLAGKVATGSVDGEAFVLLAR
jgi:membrane-bound lytic murein transglycosylase A